MLAELAAANAAFGVIKQCVSHGRDLASAGKAINDFVFAKEELRRRGEKKKKSLFTKTQKTSEFEEFMALEKLRENEQELKQIMIYTGRAGLWTDWQRFQAEARKSRQVEEKLSQKRREELVEVLVWSAAILVAIIVFGGLFYWVASYRGLI